MKKKYRNITVNIADKIGVLNFNRPEQLNAMNQEMMNEIIDAIKTINVNEEVLVAIVQGEGRAFMAGADIKEYGNQSPEEFRLFQQRGLELYSAIENAPKPWIAAVNGFALGGGFEIALACDIILASEVAKMGLPEVFLSLVPGGGGTQRLIQKIGINRAKEVLFTGGQYPAKVFHAWGIVNHVYPEEAFNAEVRHFAEKLTRRSPEAIKQLKKLAQLSLSPIPFEQKIEEEGKAVTALFFSEEAKKAIQGFIDKS